LTAHRHNKHNKTKQWKHSKKQWSFDWYFSSHTTIRNTRTKLVTLSQQRYWYRSRIW